MAWSNSGPHDDPPPGAPEPRAGQGPGKVSRAQFDARFRRRFFDPAFEAHDDAIAALSGIAWEAYSEGRKEPRTRKAGPGFADPEFELSTDWLQAREDILRAQARHDDPAGPPRALLVCGSPRNDRTCPGEASKSWRLLCVARDTLLAEGCETDVLDLSHLSSEYGRFIHPCKACVSTAMPLCNWPCSCYPNHALGQVDDWMAEIYPRWVAAHGILLVTPVHWFQVPSTLKLMIDRLVCADGGNPDPTRTHGKNARAAKALELQGWDYPRHLAGRSYAVVAHGDAEGVDAVARALDDWLTAMHLVRAGGAAVVGRYLGYFRPYATSHEDLDADAALHEEVRNAARTLARHVAQRRAGARAPDEGLQDPRPK